MFLRSARSAKASAAPSQVRHRAPTPSPAGQDLIVSLAPQKSNVNVAAIARTASCFKAQRLITTGNNHRVLEKIARDAKQLLTVEHHNSLAPALVKLKKEGYALIAFEQSTLSRSIFEFRFPRKSVLVFGNERQGVTSDVLSIADAVVEIPIFQLPHSLNVAAAASIAIYEYSKQHANSSNSDTSSRKPPSRPVPPLENVAKETAVKTDRRNRRRAAVASGRKEKNPP